LFPFLAKLPEQIAGKFGLSEVPVKLLPVIVNVTLEGTYLTVGLIRVKVPL
jgi:hypothetical protein